eukprot:Skav213851  [mRNA]  locus=scaffold2366:102222:106465:- [translate_table: standard]
MTTIEVHKLSGPLCNITVEANSTASDLKVALAKVLRVPRRQQRLLSGMMPLEDSQCLDILDPPVVTFVRIAYSESTLEMQKVRRRSALLSKAPLEMRNDHEVVLTAMQHAPCTAGVLGWLLGWLVGCWALLRLMPSLRFPYEQLVETWVGLRFAMENVGLSIERATDHLRPVGTIDYSACYGPPKDRDAIRYAAEQIMNDRDFAAAVAQWHGQAGQFVVVGAGCLGKEEALRISSKTRSLSLFSSNGNMREQRIIVNQYCADQWLIRIIRGMGQTVVKTNH